MLFVFEIVRVLALAEALVHILKCQNIILLFSILLGIAININNLFIQQVKYCILWFIYVETTLAFLEKTLIGDIMEFIYSISSYYLLAFPQQFNILKRQTPMIIGK